MSDQTIFCSKLNVDTCESIDTFMTYLIPSRKFFVTKITFFRKSFLVDVFDMKLGYIFCAQYFVANMASNRIRFLFFYIIFTFNGMYLFEVFLKINKLFFTLSTFLFISAIFMIVPFMCCQTTIRSKKFFTQVTLDPNSIVCVIYMFS